MIAQKLYISRMRTWHGLQSYDYGLETQEQARARVENSGELEVHGFEFEPVISLGKRAQTDVDLLCANGELEKQFAIRHVDRGGEATLHNPGQLVIYPVINLRQLNLGVRDFVESLERATVDLLRCYGVEAGIKPGCPGVYTTRGKMAFVGVRIQRGVSTHGISINVSNELKDFQNIRSCGILRPKLDRLANWSNNATSKLLFEHWSDLFLSGLPLDHKPTPRLTHEPFLVSRS